MLSGGSFQKFLPALNVLFFQQACEGGQFLPPQRDWYACRDEVHVVQELGAHEVSLSW